MEARERLDSLHFNHYGSGEHHVETIPGVQPQTFELDGQDHLAAHTDAAHA